jgi:carbamoyltransferase
VDPRKKWMKNYLNKRVKKREAFRPFAPAILEENINEYFENPHRSPFMLEVFPIKKSMQKLIPAVVHADGTGRIQTVGSDNQEFYKLIKEFYKITNVPVILNTSFNINKMPIVETPEDAIDCFLQTNIDVLVIGNFICSKTNGKRKSKR